jgi:hypothetical protein
MKRWEQQQFDNPFLVKVLSGCALLVFLALNFPLVFLAVVGAALSYAAALLSVSYTYRKRFKTLGRVELALRSGANTLVAALKKGFNQKVVCTLQERKRRKHLQRERERRLRVYQRELNRRKRERARRAAERR